MRYTLIIMILFLLLSCKNKEDEIGRPDPYILTEKNISEDCNAYQMLFKDGEYIFKFSLAGKCKSLNNDLYIKEYSQYLASCQDSLLNKRGYIILDFFQVNNNEDLTDSIIKITKRKFKTAVSLSETNKNSFTIKVFDKK
jgi:hypothetical protein